MKIIFFAVALIAVILIMIIVLVNIHKDNKKTLEVIFKRLEGRILFTKTNIKCKTSKIYTGKSYFNSGSCTIYALEDAVFIITPDFSALLAQNPDKYARLLSHTLVTKPNKINTNSFNNAVYIDFGESDWGTANVTLRLFGLTDDEKHFFKVLA